jgi:tetratricopeptide (TPR) repeat protein/O-antigen ligase
MPKRETGSGIYVRALEITWLAVIFLIPLFFNPQIYRVFVLNKALLLEFLVIVMLAFWVANWVQRPTGRLNLNWENIFTFPLHLSILAFGVIAVLSTIMSLTPAISFWGSYFRRAGLLILICWVLFFLIVAQQIRKRQQLLRAVYTLLISSGIVSILGIIQYFFPDVMMQFFQSPYTFGDRVSSTIGNPLFFSSFLAMVIPFNLALIVYSASKRKEGNHAKILIGLIFLLAMQFWCLWLAQYSITILLYIISVIIFLIILGIVKRWKLILGVGAVSLLALAVIAGTLLMPLLFSTPNIKNAGQGGSESVSTAEDIGLQTLGWRVELWQGAADIFLKSPEIPFSHDKLHDFRRFIGYGPETFSLTFQLFFPDNLRSSHVYRLVFVDRPHNDYLYLLTTMGLLGLISFLCILAVFFYLCFNYLRLATDDIDKLFLIAMVAAIAQYMADIFFNLSTISPELVFWLILAMTCVIGRFIRNEEPVRVELKEHTETKTGTTALTAGTRFFVSLSCALVLIIIGLGIAIRPFLADLYFKRGLELKSAGSGQAIYAYDAATRIDPEEAYYWHSLGAYEYSVARYVQQKSFKIEVIAAAAEDQNKAVELKRYDAYEYYSLADICTYWAWSGATDKWSVALSLYDKASQLFPNDAVIFDKWSLALIIKGDFDQARAKLDYAASIDPSWPETSFLSGLLLASQDKDDEAWREITAAIQDDPANLNYFIDLCRNLVAYSITSPLNDTFEIYAEKASGDWTAHALLGITSLFVDNIDTGLDEFNTAMILVPREDVGDLFHAVLKLAKISPELKIALPAVAGDWRDKLSQSSESGTLLPLLDQLIDGTE